MKKTFLTFFFFLTFALTTFVSPKVYSANVCCQYFNLNTGLSCSGWMSVPSAQCNITNGRDYCGSLRGAARQNPAMCGF